VGYGHTGEVNGVPVEPGMTITQATADDELAKDVQTAEQLVANLVEVVLTPNQFAALVSFEYNTGALASTPGLMLINGRQFETAWDQHLCLYVQDANGTPLPGLVRRRAAERALFFSP
jgi:lysozyme